MANKVTLLTSRGRRLSKLWKRDNSIEAYQQAKHFKVAEVAVNSISELAVLLKNHAREPNACLVRGKYVGENPENALRRTSEFQDRPVHWICIDVDKSECKTPGEFIRSNLPSCFHDCSYVLQYTSSHGHPSREGLLSCHLWFWLSEPRTSAELKQWAESVKLNADRALFNAVQIHYTADPVMELGLIDPFKSSRVQFVKDESDTVTLGDSSADVVIEKSAPRVDYFYDPIARAVTLENVTLETIEELRDALESLSPDRSYYRDEWISVLQALASLKGTDFEEMAYDLALEFSQRSPEKFNAEDFERVWQSMAPDVVTYKSVFAKAQADGWTNPKKQADENKQTNDTKRVNDNYQPNPFNRGIVEKKTINTERVTLDNKPAGNERADDKEEPKEGKRDKAVKKTINIERVTLDNKPTGNERVNGGKKPSEAERVKLPDKPSTTKRTTYPIDWPPGAVGQLAEYIYKSSRMPVKSFAIAGALSFMSHYNANMFYVGGSNTALNLYQCLVGDTGTGKEGPRHALIRLIKESRNNPQSRVYDEVSSGTALMRSLVNNPNALVMLDEVGIYLQTALSNNGPAYQRETIKDLMRLFGQGRARLNGKLYADTKQNIGIIEFPYVNLLGTTTAVELLDGITAKQVNNGFLNRILVVEGAGAGEMQRRPNTEVPDTLLDALGQIHLVFNQDWENESIALQYGEGAESLLEELHDRTLSAQGDDMKNLWSRTEELTVRVAGLLAVGDRQVITTEHVEWASQYVTHCISGFSKMLSSKMVDSPFHDLTTRCLWFIEHATDYAHDRQFSRLCVKGYMPKGKLLKLTKAPVKDLTAALEFLILSRQINQHISKGGGICYSIN